MLHRLRDAGNTLLVVEHDPDVIRAADRVLDMGPGPGARGGGGVLRHVPGAAAVPAVGHRAVSDRAGARGRRRAAGLARTSGAASWLEIPARAENNLQGIDVRLPLNRLVCVTGVRAPGSRPWSRTSATAPAAAQAPPTDPPGKHSGIAGADRLAEVVLVDQSPIGKTARSNPASYVGRARRDPAIFSRAPLARERGYTAGTFSFNAGRGRCPACGGNGFQHIEMQFLSDVYLRCPDCDGRRYRPEVLEVRLPARARCRPLHFRQRPRYDRDRGASRSSPASDNVRQASWRRWAAVSLEFLQLGESVPTLSGGEAQRLKLAGYLVEAERGDLDTAGVLFLLDEPTTGLHFADIAHFASGAFRAVGRSRAIRWS